MELSAAVEAIKEDAKERKKRKSADSVPQTFGGQNPKDRETDAHRAKLAGGKKKVVQTFEQPNVMDRKTDAHRAKLAGSNRQYITLGGRIKKLFADEAKKRQKAHGGTAPGKKKTLPENLREVKPDRKANEASSQAGAAKKRQGKRNDLKKDLPANLRESKPDRKANEASAQAGAAVGVSGKSIDHAAA